MEGRSDWGRYDFGTFRRRDVLTMGRFDCKATQLPPQKGGDSSPHFSAHVYCGQTAGWTRIPLGTELGLGPGDIVLVC